VSYPPSRNLQALRAELRDRLGFASSGPNSGINQGLIDSFLKSAQNFLYNQFDFNVLSVRTGLTTETNLQPDLTQGIGQTFLDYPADANKERILKLYVNAGVAPTSQWLPLTPEIPVEWYNITTNQPYPQRYELRDQIEIWPGADRVYPIRVWYVKSLSRFSQDGDLPSIDDDLIFLHALATAKAHYKQPDAATYGTQLMATLARLKRNTFGSKTFRRDRPSMPGLDPVPQPKPVVV
jgi:hypothetical protein